MRLARLLKKITKIKPAARLANIDISSICCNSKKVEPGALFVAIDGIKNKGSDFINEALRRGAACIVLPIFNADKRKSNADTRRFTEGNLCSSVTFPARRDNLCSSVHKKIFSVRTKTAFIPVRDTRYALALLADEFFGHPSGRLKVVGVTGTNGKTTTTYLIRSILEQAGFSPGIIGTINYSFKDTLMPAANTTPGPLELEQLLRQMLDAGCSYCIMEVSSHGLDQKRTEGIRFEAAIFTNLTQDHLDYHRDMENYFLAKSKLFNSLSQDAYAIINLDSPFALRLKSLTRGKIITYAIDSDAQVRATGLSLSLEGSEFNLGFKNSRTKIKTNLIGRHNISNSLAAIAFSLSQGIELPDIKRALANFPGVRGRLDRVKSKERNIFIDYAHTPDALENVLSILRQFSKRRLILVFGCGGERDHLKRPLMGSIAGKYADTVIITSDNPRSEKPQLIAEEIARGIGPGEYKIILERRKAIEYALAKSKAQDIVLIAGKGHENYQIFKDKRIEFDDSLIASEWLRKKGW